MIRSLLALALVGCIDASTEPDDGDTDSDADTDSDTDADTDSDSDTDAAPVTIVMTTTLGAITLDLNLADAPITTANFLTYVDEGFFDGDDGIGATMFHRVISGFMIQGGGYTSTAALKDTHDAIVLESDNGLSNLRGTIAMARTNAADSATTQFFINHVDNTFLDYASALEPGYAVFGEVKSGLEVLDALASVATVGADQPVDLIEITDCERQ